MSISKCVFLSAAITMSAALGCGNQDSSVAQNDDFVNDLLGTDDDSPDASRTQRDTSEEFDGPESTDPSMRTVHNTSQSDPAGLKQSTPVGEKLELHLEQGDRFPLVKTVEQTLIQKSDIAPAMARTKLELTLIITVNDVKADAILLGVRYNRVSYKHDVNGQLLSYDSASHQGEVPWDAIPYAGMVNNGFSFWLGRNNSIRELVGYKAFLEQCVANVPISRRETLMSEISNRFGDDGVANFVDDTIGLLPYDNTVDQAAATRVMPGDLWTRERRLMQPIPIHLTSTYRLASLNKESAEIEITGRVAAGEAGAPSDVGRLRILGGQSVGRCVVDRATGLPLEMNLSRFIKMQLTTSDNQRVIQEKQIETKIRTFPEMRGSTVERHQPNYGIQRASGTTTQGEDAQPIPTQGGNTLPVRAVYPD